MHKNPYKERKRNHLYKKITHNQTNWTSCSRTVYPVELYQYVLHFYLHNNENNILPVRLITAVYLHYIDIFLLSWAPKIIYVAISGTRSPYGNNTKTTARNTKFSRLSVVLGMRNANGMGTKLCHQLSALVYHLRNAWSLYKQIHWDFVSNSVIRYGP